ncbi:tRNA-specific 2-thiouridylase MnmA [Candidatus Karelsulcia muelleri]|uniref:tRNA-specific 2-thiouridylase MnmA n=1 Tax=Candidatus Karelsulcia muelleri TaxID=336810 RepID=A0A654M396_9FLAO|nr:tRNA 2-thiouridine(34) synthase MnmA [Candidatus Karelsulcia muelleri]ALP70096.1 tRNA-specific 2-thiouridylase MnmA [Candidatus Karelsulcia muelleri]
MKRVIVGMSGGVDSSVAALLLKKQGYDVIGIFLKYFDNKCPWREDSIDAMLVSQSLKIPFYIIDITKNYKNLIIDYLYKEYKKGYTPNPDIICNSKIKFNFFLEKSIFLKSHFIATGHYVIKKEVNENGKIYYKMRSGIDDNKDQSYFLCLLNKVQIKKSIFPLGWLNKKEVREIAKKYNLINANKKDSQGICFIGKIKFFNFLKKKLAEKKGIIIEINKNSHIFKLYSNIEYKKEYGKIIGHHIGAHYFTKGQRKGLKIGGYKYPLFVIEKDIKKNILYVGMGKNHPGLYTKVICIKNYNIHWIKIKIKIKIKINKKKMKIKVECRIRYRQNFQKASLYKKNNDLYVEFEIPQLAVNGGQFIVWYINNEVIGSGLISSNNEYSFL